MSSAWSSGEQGSDGRWWFRRLADDTWWWFKENKWPGKDDKPWLGPPSSGNLPVATAEPSGAVSHMIKTAPWNRPTDTTAPTGCISPQADATPRDLGALSMHEKRQWAMNSITEKDIAPVAQEMRICQQHLLSQMADPETGRKGRKCRHGLICKKLHVDLGDKDSERAKYHAQQRYNLPHASLFTCARDPSQVVLLQRPPLEAAIDALFATRFGVAKSEHAIASVSHTASPDGDHNAGLWVDEFERRRVFPTRCSHRPKRTRTLRWGCIFCVLRVPDGFLTHTKNIPKMVGFWTHAKNPPRLSAF